ncbi:MAG: DUF4153 domain-containing protein, partial [Flammeovirgaceae bacterium]|nr:DUF4153 domain-containing protein [Flammeovirgaceae bacterium]
MISFPSLESLWLEATSTLRRFPIVLFLTILTTILAIALSEVTDNANEHWALTRLVMSSALATLFCLSVALMTEKYRWGYGKGLLYQLLAIALTAIYYWFDTEVENNTTLIRFALLLIFVHLWVAIAPYIMPENNNGFWQYNQRLFIRFLISLLYTGVLYVGLALAIQAIKTLFNADINDRIFSRLFIFLIGIFNTWFFLAGIPRDFEALEKDESYPKGLKLFTQYVLLPLVVIYFVILYAYS